MNPTALIADDEPLLRERLRGMLQLAGTRDRRRGAQRPRGGGVVR
jgi:DNA-binding NarL/FixJ family response regulator